MFKATILKDNVVYQEAKFPTQNEADVWIASLTSFGQFEDPAFTSTIEDTTTIDIVTEFTANGLKAQEIGARVIAKVWAINEAKDIDAQSFGALRADTNLQNIERLLWNGSLKTAKILIQALDEQFFNTQEKLDIIAVLDNQNGGI